MIDRRRRLILDQDLLIRASLAWFLMVILLVISGFSSIQHRIFHDGDDIMRLLQVRDWLAGQGWFDTSQYRLNAPFGSSMHWSRLVDVPIAVLIVILSPVLGQPLAEHVTAIAIPFGTLWLAVMLIGRIAWHLFDEEAASFVCIAAILAAPLLHQMRPMRIDHHGWQIVCFLVAVNALMARDARRGGWALGGALALWLHISMEALPMVMVFAAIAFARWMRSWADRQWLVSMLQSLTFVSGALYVLTHGFAPTSPMCDALGPAHLVGLLIAAIGTTGLGRGSTPRPWLFTVLVLGTIALTGAVMVFSLAPQCAGGSFSGIDPAARDIWLANVTESKPLWHHQPDMLAQMLVPPIIAIIISLRLAMRSADWLHRWHLEYAALLVATLAMAIMLPRSSGLVAALAAVPIGIQLKQWLRQLRKIDRPKRQAFAVAGITASLLPALPLTLLMHATPSMAANPAAQADACNIREALPALGYRPANVLAPIDLGPAILLDSPHSVTASAHHRAHKGIGDTIRTFTGTETQAHSILLQRRIDYVIACPGAPEIELYRSMGPQNFANRLVSGNAPNWLMPIAHDGGAGVLVWRVIG